MHPLSVPCIAMALVNFFVGSYYLYFYIQRPRIKEHLPFALLCFCVGIYDIFSAGLYNARSIDEGVFWQRLQLNSGVVVSLFLLWFNTVFVREERNPFLRFSFLWFFLLMFAAIFAGPELTLSAASPAVKHINFLNLLGITYYEGSVGLVYLVEIISILIVFTYFIFLYVRHYRRTKSSPFLVILACVAVYFVSIWNDSMVAMGIYSFIYLSEYSFFILVLAMAYTLLNNFVHVYKEYEQLNIHLEQKVTERTAEIKELNDHLKNLADHDALTGAFNRRFFNEYFDIEVRRAMNFLEHKAPSDGTRENDMNFGLAMMDIDYFKKVNDVCGHLAGDAVLKKVVEIIGRNIFSRDVLCRYGGDEFALLMTKTSKSGILQAAEKIRKEIEGGVYDPAPEPKRWHITISIGLVTFDEVLSRGSMEILSLADSRLLRAKAEGRNRIIYADKD